MRRIVLAFVTTVSALVLLFSYHTSTNSAGGALTVIAAAPSPQASAPTTKSSSRTRSASTTVDGDVVGTQWGPVQVRLTVSGGRITDATAVLYPNGNGRDAEINSYALPILQQAAVQAQSAQIDAVSGATVTSDGYITSLQSAIDKAHL